MEFKYQASTDKGDLRNGTIDAASRKEARDLLKKEGLLVINLSSDEEKGGKAEQKKKGMNISIGRVSVVDKVLFAKNLSVMIKSGLPINEALQVLHDQAKGKFQKILAAIILDIESGKNLADAMAKFPKVFPPYFTSIVGVSEESGTLEENMAYLAKNLEKDWALRRKVKGAMMYPVFIFGATLSIGLGLAYFVLPKVTKLFKSFDFELPITTRALIKFSEILQDHGIIIFIGLVAGIIFLSWFLRLKFIKPITHPVFLKAPILGKISKQVNLSRFNRTMGILLKSGLPIDRSVQIATNTLSNVVYKKKLEIVATDIVTGRTLSKSLDQFPSQFPPLVTRMIKVGEDSGKLEETMIYLATYFEEEVDNITKNLSTILEPVLLIVIGVVAGGLALSIITPIYQISGQLKG
ncbi:MAG: type II secretion system F family protein [Patescibacteria group bacterium]